MNKKIKALTSTQLNEENFIKAISTRVFPVVRYKMIDCDFNQKKNINGLDKLI